MGCLFSTLGPSVANDDTNWLTLVCVTKVYFNGKFNQWYGPSVADFINYCVSLSVWHITMGSLFYSDVGPFLKGG